MGTLGSVINFYKQTFATQIKNAYHLLPIVFKKLHMRKKIFFVLSAFLVVVITQAQIQHQQKLDSLFDLLEQHEKGMGAVSIFKNGTEVYNRPYGFAHIETKTKNNAGTRFRIGSITKTFTATIIMKLIEEKKLTLTTKLSQFYPQIEQAENITIEQLLRHRSGIFNLTNDANYARGWHKDFFTKAALLEKIMSKKNIFAPDEKASYSNSGYILLSLIAEDVTKTDYNVLVEKYITAPLKLKNTFVGKAIDRSKNEAVSYSKMATWVLEEETDMSIPRGAGAIVSTPTELNIFIQALMNGKVVTPESLTMMKNIKDDFGLGIFPIPFYDKKSFGHTGGIDGFQSVVTYFPNDSLSVAITSNAGDYAVNSILINLLNVCFNKDLKLPVFVTLSNEELDQYTGTYASSGFPLKITISRKDNTLMGQASGQPAFPLDYFEKDGFKFDRAGLKMKFNPSEKKMTLIQGGREFVLTKE